MHVYKQNSGISFSLWALPLFSTPTPSEVHHLLHSSERGLCVTWLPVWPSQDHSLSRIPFSFFYKPESTYRPMKNMERGTLCPACGTFFTHLLSQHFKCPEFPKFLHQNHLSFSLPTGNHWTHRPTLFRCTLITAWALSAKLDIPTGLWWQMFGDTSTPKVRQMVIWVDPGVPEVRTQKNPGSLEPDSCLEII